MSLQYWQLCGSPERSQFVAFDNAYHGDTTGAASLGGVETFTNRFAKLHFPVNRVAGVSDLALLDPSRIAAIIIEPLVQGAAGIRLWPPECFTRRDRCGVAVGAVDFRRRVNGIWKNGPVVRLRTRGRSSRFSLSGKGTHRRLPAPRRDVKHRTNLRSVPRRLSRAENLLLRTQLLRKSARVCGGRCKSSNF